MMKPLARSEKLVVEDLAEELLVYDSMAVRAHCLNRSAAVVWRGCDGTRGIPELVDYLSSFGLPADEEIVRLALGDLRRAELLVTSEPKSSSTEVDRRAVLRRLALAGVSSALLPLMTSAPVAAQSALGSCVSSLQCIPGLTECTPCHVGGTNQCTRRVCRAGSCVHKPSTTCP